MAAPIRKGRNGVPPVPVARLHPLFPEDAMKPRLWMVVPALAGALLVGGCDAPRVTEPRADASGGGGPSFLNGPTVSVSYPGSTHPVISWSAVSGVSTYYVIYEVERWDSNGYQGTDRISVAATTSTSATDWNRTYTGITICDFPGGVQEIYSYRVETFVGNTRVDGLAAAHTGDC
jgi:hypothetical protein